MKKKTNLDSRLTIYAVTFAILMLLSLAFNDVPKALLSFVLCLWMIGWQGVRETNLWKQKYNETVVPYKTLLRSKIGKNWQGYDKDHWRVVCAANRNRENGLIATGARHLDKVMRMQIFALSGYSYEECVDWQNVTKTKPMRGSKSWLIAEQGFLDNYGDFLTRKEAYIVAKYANQIADPIYGVITVDNGETLFSENLY